MEIAGHKLTQAEKAIEDIADALGISEQEVVEILQHGMEHKSPIGGQLSRTNQYFIDEMKATFNCY